MKKRRIKLDNNPRGPAIELLAEGQQLVAAGTHSSGIRYQWKDGLPETLPTLTLDQLNSVWTTLTQTYATDTQKRESQTVQGKDLVARDDTTWSVYTQITEPEWQELLQALRFLLDKVGSNDDWSEVGYALLSLQGTRPAEQLWIDFSRKAAGYEEGAAEKWWDDHRTQTPRTDYRHIFKMARDRGLAKVADPAAFSPVLPDTSGSDTGSAQETDRSGDNELNVIPDAPSRPIIQLVPGQYNNIVDQMETLMVPEMYVQGPHLTRRSQAHTEDEIRRADDALMLIVVEPEWVKKRVMELAEIQKYVKESWREVDLGMDYVNGLVNLKGWTKLRPLSAIARAPFVREDGSICDQPGYDPRARVLYVPSTTYPDIPANPDKDCAREAIERIRGVFDQFPYKEPASESAFLSHILTEAARLAVDQCPIFFYTAPVASTGKGLLQDMAARIVHGSKPAIRTWVSDGDEIRKSLYASVLAGDRSLWFDNVPNGSKVRSPEICAFITSETWKDRKLGASETIGVPNKCVLVASGNNITPVSDLARRSIVIRLDANVENLKGRVFKIPEGQLRPYVAKNRPQMLVDALTVIKAFHAAKGIPEMPTPLQSFGQWSHFCRDPLIWLGFADPVITQKETDDETGSVGTIFERLYAQFGDREFTALDVARLVNGISDSSGELANELIENGCTEPNQPKKVGYWLRGYSDRISHGIKMVHARNSKIGVKWRFIIMHKDPT